VYFYCILILFCFSTIRDLYVKCKTRKLTWQKHKQGSNIFEVEMGVERKKNKSEKRRYFLIEESGKIKRE